MLISFGRPSRDISIEHICMYSRFVCFAEYQRGGMHSVVCIKKGKGLRRRGIILLLSNKYLCSWSYYIHLLIIHASIILNFGLAYHSSVWARWLVPAARHLGTLAGRVPPGFRYRRHSQQTQGPIFPCLKRPAVWTNCARVLALPGNSFDSRFGTWKWPCPSRLGLDPRSSQEPQILDSR